MQHLMLQHRFEGLAVGDVLDVVDEHGRTTAGVLYYGGGVQDPYHRTVCVEEPRLMPAPPGDSAQERLTLTLRGLPVVGMGQILD